LVVAMATKQNLTSREETLRSLAAAHTMHAKRHTELAELALLRLAQSKADRGADPPGKGRMRRLGQAEQARAPG
jgi:hypothetical protein